MFTEDVQGCLATQVYGSTHVIYSLNILSFKWLKTSVGGNKLTSEVCTVVSIGLMTLLLRYVHLSYLKYILIIKNIKIITHIPQLSSCAIPGQAPHPVIC